MKKRRIFQNLIFVFFLCVGAVLGTADSAWAELGYDAGLMTATDHDPSFETKWTLVGVPDGLGNPAEYKYGSASLKCSTQTSAEGGRTITSSMVTGITPEASYSAHIWWRATATADPSIRLAILWYTAADAFISESQSDAISLTAAATWEQASYTGVTAPLTAAKAKFKVYHWRATATNRVTYFDGACLVAGDTPPDPYDGGLLTATDHDWRFETKWTLVGVPDGLGNPAEYKYGSASLKCSTQTSAEGGRTITSSMVTGITPEASYSAHIWWRATATADPRIRLAILWYTAADAFISESQSDAISLTAAATWEQASYTGVTAPLTAAKAKFKVYHWKITTDRVTYFDGARLAPAPTVTSTDPDNRGQGATNQNITVSGTNFVDGANVTFSGTGITVNSTTYVSSSELTANINIAESATTGFRDVTVTNPDSQSGTLSNGFTVNARPTVTSITPNSGTTGATVNITNLAGTNFDTTNGATVKLTKTGYSPINATSVVVVSSTQITCTFDLAGAATGTWNVVVTNLGDQGTGTGSALFEVIGPPTVTTQDATSVEETTATLNGNITATGGEDPTRYLDWDTDSGAPYANEVACGVGGTGAYSTDLTGFSEGTLHYFRARAVNSGGTGTGSERSFLTKPDPPTAFSATTISGTRIDLAWTNGTGGDGGYIEYATPTAPSPWDVGDGTKIDADGKIAGESHSHTGLPLNTSYYYKIWSYAIDDSTESDGTSTRPYGDSPQTANATTEEEAAIKGMMIDEVGWNSAATGDGVVGSSDFIEIYNDSASPVDISSYYISDGAGADLRWASATVPAYGFWVIVDGAGTDQIVGNIRYSFEDNRVSGGALELPGTDCAIAVSSADTNGLSTNLGSIIDFVAYTNGANTPAAGVVTDVNAVIAQGAWDLYGTGSTANNWSATDSQPGVIISQNFIRRIAYDTTSTDYASHWGASATANIGHTAFATKLVFTVAPSAVSAGSESTAFTVQRQEAGNDPITTGTTTVNLTSNSTGAAKKFRATPGGGAVSSVNITAGNSTVDFYYYDERAGSWTITASATDLTSATTALTVNPAAANKLAFTTQPSATAVVGFPFVTQPRVSVEDAYDNVITSDNTTAITLERGLGSGTLQGILIRQVSSGVATYTNVSHNTIETINIIATSSPSYTSATSNNIVVSDNTLPLINITEPVPTWESGAWVISYTLTDADNHSCTGYPEYSLNGTIWITASTTPASGASIGTPGAKTITWATATDLTEDNTVYFRMRAHDGANYGSYGYMGDVASPGTPFGIDNVAPSGLANFKASSATSNSITFSWTACTDGYFNHYEIWYDDEATIDRGASDIEWDNDNDSNLATMTTTSTTITGLTSGNIYYFKIWAVDNYGNEQTIAEITVGLANVQESAPTSSTSELTWTPFTPSAATFYRYRIWYGINRADVENRTPPATYWDDSNDVDLRFRTTTSTIITGLSGGTTYYMQLWGIYNPEVPTPVVTITTPSAAKEEAESTAEKWGCFIATSAYSSSGESIVNSPESIVTLITDYRSPVTILQRFRDECLLTNSLGRAFVRFYYRHSPQVADFIRDKEPLKAIVRFYLKPVVWGAKWILK